MDNLLDFNGDVIFSGTPLEVYKWSKDLFNRERVHSVDVEYRNFTAEWYFGALPATVRYDFMRDKDKVTKLRLKAYMSAGGSYCGIQELMDFWESLDEDEKNHYRTYLAEREG